MVKVEFAYMTHPGRVRKKNQDNLICIHDYLPLEHDRMDEPAFGMSALSSPVLFGVFDGMGGEEHGEAAAYLAAKTAASWKTSDEHDLGLLCRDMNKRICDYVAEHHIHSSGTTASLLLFDQHEVISCHIGDSRIYRCREGVLEQLTRDDVWPGYRGKKAPLLQCLGIPEEEMMIKPQLRHFPLESGVQFMICTDGLTDSVEHDQIAEIISSGIDLKSKTQMLMDIALEGGGRDNITVFLVRQSADKLS